MRRRRLAILTLAAGVLVTGVLCRPACLVLATPASPAAPPCHGGSADPLPDDDCCLTLLGLLSPGAAGFDHAASARLPAAAVGTMSRPDPVAAISDAGGGRHPPAPHGPPLFLRDRTLLI